MGEQHSGKLNIVNRDTYLNFQPSPKTKYRSKIRIKKLRIKKIDHDQRYEELKKQGLTAEITNPEIYVNGKKPIDGIFSSRYGADTTSEAPMYSCNCHKLTGANNQGRVCPDCGTVCRTIDADLRTTLYIDIAPYHVLTYHGYKQFCRVFQDKVIQDIIHSTKRINQQGKIIDDGKPTIMDLYDDYEEKYEKKLNLEKRFAFTSKIPVYSARLRPLMQFGMSMTILDVNKKYLSIVRARNILKASPFFHLERKVEIQRTLNQIQQDWIDIFGLVEEQLNGKYGAFRKSLASGRVDYSSRMVISLDQTLMPHEIDLPYSTIMVKYEEEIANILCKLDGIDLSHAISLVEENKEIRNEKFVNIINQMLKTGYGKWEIINRPPTISESSLLYCRIRRINKNENDMTMHLPPDILSLLAADFDGDQLTAISVKDPAFHPLFLTMCPTYTFIDRANGKFNNAMGFQKDYAAIISAAWIIDEAFDNYLTHPDEDSAEVMRKLGIDDSMDQEAVEERTNIMRKLAKVPVDNVFRKRYCGDAQEDDIIV